MFGYKKKLIKETEELSSKIGYLKEEKILLETELNAYKKYFEKERSNMQKEFSLYKQEEYLKINIDVQERKTQNYIDLDDIRQDCRTKELKLAQEVSRLEGQRDALKVNLEYPKEIERLNNIILELIKNQNNYLNFVEKK